MPGPPRHLTSRARRRRSRHVLMAAAAAALLAPGARAEETQTLLNACWVPSALAGIPAEKNPRKGIHDFDKSPPVDLVGANEPAASVPHGVIRRVALPQGRKLIALTFDLCEQPGEVAGYDGGVVDYLRKEGVKATFFAGGKWLRSHEERARQLMADPLFEIGNHSEAHHNLRQLNGARLADEILGPQRSYAAIRMGLTQTQCARDHSDAMSAVPAAPTLFRFPYGACNGASVDAVNKLGLTAIQWDFSTGDPAPTTSARAIAQTILHRARPGSIIVSHANGRGWHTAEGLALAIPQLRAKGFEFVTVSELLAAGKPVVEQRCYDNRPGDTDRYDFLVAHRSRPVAGWNTTIHQ
jgi:peptidoglycan/xylan/chitin deacetylase (PgdA/CDA1 family)